MRSADRKARWSRHILLNAIISVTNASKGATINDDQLT